jgi:hypothetical protein
LRQRGSSVSTACNWIINYVIVQITPPAIANIGWRTYIIFACLNALWVPIIYFFFPETKGELTTTLEFELSLLYDYFVLSIQFTFAGDGDGTKQLTRYFTGLALEDVDRLFAGEDTVTAHELHDQKRISVVEVETSGNK